MPDAGAIRKWLRHAMRCEAKVSDGRNGGFRRKRKRVAETRRKKRRISSKTILMMTAHALTLQSEKSIIIIKKLKGMKKLFAMLVVCVFTASVSTAQVNHQREMPRPYFERLDSAGRSQVLKARQEAWKKMVKKNDKKWQKHMAMMPGHGMAPWQWRSQGFKKQPQEIMPKFIGGEEALKSWIEENISYPVMAENNGVEGKVVVAFDVNPDGFIGNVRIEESANPLLDDEVVSKINDMPRWIPAFQNGRAVKVKYTLPINFTNYES